MENAPTPTPDTPGHEAASPQRVRLRLTLSYDGTLFHGWAAQRGLRTVEGEICAALDMVTQKHNTVTVAGRTDAGVHARHQVAHVDVPAAFWQRTDARRLAHRLNGILARRFGEFMASGGLSVPRGTQDVLIHEVAPVLQDFDARFSATGRAYRYLLADAASQRSPLRRHDVTWVPGNTLDLDAMNEAARPLLGEHEFLAYCRPREGATTIRTLTRLEFTRIEEGLICAHVEADAFCHSMVRSLVGAAIEVGRGQRPRTWMAELLAGASRQKAAPIAPPQGLSLMRVDYPAESEWADQARMARRRRDLAPAAGSSAHSAHGAGSASECCE